MRAAQAAGLRGVLYEGGDLDQLIAREIRPPPPGKSA